MPALPAGAGGLAPTVGGALSAGQVFRLLDAALRQLPASRFPGSEGVSIVLAISGGPDSLALLLAAAEAAPAFRERGFRFHSVTVDHALRPGSGQEAEHVAAIAARMGVSHETRQWHGERRSSNLQGEAREARYRLLIEAAHDVRAAAIVTAHHQDDQIETHFLARARHAGDRGLAGMRAIREVQPGLHLLRPFLEMPGACLKAAVAGRGLPAIDDPSNDDRRFARVRLRQSLAAAAFDRSEVLKAIACHAGRRDIADARIRSCVSRLLAARTLAVDATGVVRLDPVAFASVKGDLAVEIVSRIVRGVGGAVYPPARVAVERLVDRLHAALPAERVSATLGGTAVEKNGWIVFFREFGRKGPAPVAIDALKRPVLFDRRLAVLIEDPDEALSPAPEDARLVPLGSLGRGNRLERTLPVLLDGEGRIIGAPLALRHKSPQVPYTLALAEQVSWRILNDVSPARPNADALEREEPFGDDN